MIGHEYVVYVEDEPGVRRYWQGPRTRVWRPGEAGRAGAARFPDMHAARNAIAASRVQRARLPRVGYEYLPVDLDVQALIPEVMVR